MIDFVDLARMVLDTLGLVNVSAVAFLGALVVYAWRRKGTRYGSQLAHAGSTLQHDLKVAALAVLVLLDAGSVQLPTGGRPEPRDVRSVRGVEGAPRARLEGGHVA